MKTAEKIQEMVKQIVEESDEKFKLNEQEVENVVQIEDETHNKKIIVCWGRNDTGGDWDGVSKTIKITISPAEK